MYSIKKLALTNIKSYESAEIIPSTGVNLLVGHNNAGKSTVLQSIFSLTEGNSSGTASRLRLKRVNTEQHLISGVLVNGSNETNFRRGSNYTGSAVPTSEPGNGFYPHWGTRKSTAYDETINLAASRSVHGNHGNLYAKVDRLSDPGHPAHKQYISTCEAILGMVITSKASTNGKKAGISVGSYDTIAIDEMGEGVPNILGLLVDLCVADGKIFLIEEPENDLHPYALKALLGLMKESAKSNQFFVTTHSNIVVRTLGAEPAAKTFQIESEMQNGMPTSTIREVTESPEDRLEVLRHLGYDIEDSGLWSAWLIFEESSAERIVRDFLIPWFTPKIHGRVRTFSARCADEVEAKFDDFSRVFTYAHLEPVYKNRCWVAVDGDEKGIKIVDVLSNRFGSSGWEPSRFRTFSESQFERYYPDCFQQEAELALSEPDKKRKRELKRQLLIKVVEWLKEDPVRGKAAIEKSAGEIITLLSEVSEYIANSRQASLIV